MAFWGTLLLGLILAAWTRVLGLCWQRLRSGQRLIDHQPKPAVPWGGLDLALSVFVIGLTLSLALRQLHSWYPALATGAATATERLASLPASDQLKAMLVSKSAELIGLALVIGFTVLRSGAAWSDFGFEGGPNWQDVRQAARMFALMVVPVYGLMLVLQQLAPKQYLTNVHPILQMLRDSPEPARLMGGIFVMAVILAPLSEELMFRVLLQSWFQNVDVAARSRRLWLTTRRPFDVQAVTGNLRPSTGEGLDVAQNVPGIWPIASSSLLFALAHFGHALDPIPLFVLALGIGYLYARTGRYWPCVLMHMMNNGLSFVMMCAYLASGQLPTA